MHNIGNGLARGCSYVLEGISEFYKRPRLWVYLILPFIFVKGICLGVSYIVITRYITPMVMYVEEVTADWSMETLAFVVCAAVKWLSIITLIIFLAGLSSTLFDMLGSVFFTYLVRRYEHIVYHRPLKPNITQWQDFMNMINCIIFSIGTMIMYIPLLCLGFAFPVVSHILTAWFIGYRYGLSYCSEAGFNRGWSLNYLRNRFQDNRQVLYGFGVTCFVLLLIPFLSALLIPGMVIGGTRLVNEEYPHEDFEFPRVIPV